MRVKLQHAICHDDGHEETVTDVITFNKHNHRIEHLGASLAESKELLSTLQRHLLQQQVDTFLDTCSTCPDCGTPLKLKGPLSPLVSHLVWHVSGRQSEARALRLHTAHDRIIPPPIGFAH